jgi:hypothetical protein
MAVPTEVARRITTSTLIATRGVGRGNHLSLQLFPCLAHWPGAQIWMAELGVTKPSIIGMQIQLCAIFSLYCRRTFKAGDWSVRY